MRMVYRLLLCWCLLYALCLEPAKADHLLGGEISYKCLGNGIYRFRLVVFRDCSGVHFNVDSLFLGGTTVITCYRVGVYDATPKCDSNLTGFKCDPPPFSAGNQIGALGKFVYEGEQDLSGLGPAPPGGYTWHTINLPCCRNGNENTHCTDQSSMILRITMYRFVDANGIALSPAQICDNSPQFLEDPSAIAVLNPHDTITFNNFAQDVDQADLVRYYIDLPWSSYFTPCPFTSNYNATRPIPGLIGPAIDSVSGSLRYVPLQQGSYQLAFRVESKRCGQKISEIFRDFQLNIVPNPGTAAPPFNPNESSLAQTLQQRAPQFFPVQQNPNAAPTFDVMVYAKDTMRIPVSIYDYFPSLKPGPVPNQPGPPDYEVVHLYITSTQLGTNGASTTLGCLFPPCATIEDADGNPPIQIHYSVGGEMLGFGFKDTAIINAFINWQPVCANLPDSTLSICGTGITSYMFGAATFDDACPLRGKSSQIFTVKVKSLPLLDPPTLRNVSVQPDNQSVKVIWSQFIDRVTIDSLDYVNYFSKPDSIKRIYSVNRRLGSFDSFRIYRANSPAGPYSLIGQTYNLQDTSFIDYAVVSGMQYYYYITNISGCANFESMPSEVLKTINLQLTNNIPMGLAELFWDSLTLGKAFPATCAPVVYIEREQYDQNPGFWERADTLPMQFVWNEGITVCNDTLNYRVGFLDSSLEISYSWIQGDRFRDIYEPEEVPVIQASVDNNLQIAYLSWEICPDKDVIGYVIYKANTNIPPLSRVALDTVQGRENTFWYDQVSGQDPYNQTLYYAVSALDSCGNQRDAEIQNTICLKATIDNCVSAALLSWNPYEGWGNDIDTYEIWRQDGTGTNPSILATLPANQNNYRYFDNQNLVNDTAYCYTIVARRNDDSTAISCRQCVTGEFIKQPQFTYIRQVTVDTLTNRVFVRFVSDALASSDRFLLERGTSESDMSVVATFEVSQIPAIGGFYEVHYMDQRANPTEQSYLYRVLAYDVCGQLFDSSEFVKSIYLEGKGGEDFVNQLNWNEYENWLGGLESYTIVRHIPGVDLNYLPLANTSLGSVVYTDDVVNIPDEQGKYLYFIQALEGNGNPLGFKDTATSNIVTVVQEPRLFFPSGFMPGGINKEFRGKGVFIEETHGFKLEIYNRWGERVFESKDVSRGWDGNYKGEEAMAGVYVFVVRFMGRNRQEYNQKGTFTLIR